MRRTNYYKLLCYYCGYRVGFETLCRGERTCLACTNSDMNGVCLCSKDKPENEITCPYFRYLAR